MAATASTTTEGSGWLYCGYMLLRTVAEHGGVNQWLQIGQVESTDRSVPSSAFPWNELKNEGVKWSQVQRYGESRKRMYRQSRHGRFPNKGRMREKHDKLRSNIYMRNTVAIECNAMSNGIEVWRAFYRRLTARDLFTDHFANFKILIILAFLMSAAFAIQIQSGYRKYTIKVLHIPIDQRTEQFKLQGRNKTVVLESNRPFFRNRNLKHRKPDWKVVEGQVDHLSSLEPVKEAILKYLEP